MRFLLPICLPLTAHCALLTIRVMCASIRNVDWVTNSTWMHATVQFPKHLLSFPESMQITDHDSYEYFSSNEDSITPLRQEIFIVVFGPEEPTLEAIKDLAGKIELITSSFRATCDYRFSTSEIIRYLLPHFGGWLEFALSEKPDSLYQTNDIICSWDRNDTMYNKLNEYVIQLRNMENHIRVKASEQTRIVLKKFDNSNEDLIVSYVCNSKSESTKIAKRLSETSKIPFIFEKIDDFNEKDCRCSSISVLHRKEGLFYMVIGKELPCMHEPFSWRLFWERVRAELNLKCIVPSNLKFYPKNRTIYTGVLGQDNQKSSMLLRLPKDVLQLIILKYIPDDAWTLKMLCKGFPIPFVLPLSTSKKYIFHLRTHLLLLDTRLSSFVRAALEYITSNVPQVSIGTHLNVLSEYLLHCPNSRTQDVLNYINDIKQSCKLSKNAKFTEVLDQFLSMLSTNEQIWLNKLL